MSQEQIAIKEKEVSEVLAKIEKSKSVVLFDYRGITVSEDTAMRNEMRESNVEYKVIKNRIMLRAFNKAGFEGFDKVLEGPTAVAFGYDDAVAPAKVLCETVSKLKKMAVKGGVVEGKIASEEEIVALSKIPAKPVLVGQLLGMLTNPMRSLAVALSEIAKKQEA